MILADFAFSAGRRLRERSGGNGAKLSFPDDRGISGDPA
jgi:hypothetical protein